MYNTDIPTRAELPTSAQLVRSTAIAVAAATVILVTIVLPSEYAYDPTGIGTQLGLTEMGEIKMQLAEEAAADEQMMMQQQAPANQTPALPAPNQGSSLPARLIQELFIGSAMAQTAATRSDEMTIELTPGQGAEVKLVMLEGAVANFSWTVQGGVVNYDIHGDGGGKSTSYEKGRGVPSHEGVVTAAFTGNHGWFWRNRGKENVTVTLRTNGAYSEIKRAM